MLDRIIRGLIIGAITIAIIASFTVRAHGAEVTAAPCMTKPHHKHVSAAPVQSCITPPPCLVVAPEPLEPAIATPHTLYRIIEITAPAEPAMTTADFWLDMPSGLSSVAHAMPAPEVGLGSAPGALTLLSGLLLVIRSGRKHD